jgi:hypothetical protein
MTPNQIASLRSIVDGPLEAQILSASEELSLLFDALLDDEDLKEVFGEFLVPVESVQ